MSARILSIASLSPYTFHLPSFALKGLSTWRRQLRGNAEYDLARRVLRITYRVRDEIEAARKPMASPGEVKLALKEAGVTLDGVSSEESLTIQSWATTARRWNRVHEAVADLRVEMREMQALWGIRRSTLCNRC
jgi:hypothetical protein